MPDSPVWHIFASRGYAPGIIAVNFTWMERGFNACQTHQHVPIYLQPFPSNSTRNFKKFAILAHFGLPGYAPGTITVNVTRL